MFRSLVTLLRGAAHDADEAFDDAHAIPLLRQQLRECAQAVSATRKALALAIAQNEQQAERNDKVASRIADLEERTVAALEQGQTNLAQEAAETIARLQDDRDAGVEVMQSLEADVRKLRESVTTSEERLRALKRGQQIAVAADKAHRLTHAIPGGSSTALRDAEATLVRLRTRQTETEAANAALDTLENTHDPKTLREKLAASGCGTPLKTTAEAVLERLRSRAASPA